MCPIITWEDSVMFESSEDEEDCIFFNISEEENLDNNAFPSDPVQNEIQIIDYDDSNFQKRVQALENNLNQATKRIPNGEFLVLANLRMTKDSVSIKCMLTFMLEVNVELSVICLTELNIAALNNLNVLFGNGGYQIFSAFPTAGSLANDSWEYKRGVAMIIHPALIPFRLKTINDPKGRAIGIVLQTAHKETILIACAYQPTGLNQCKHSKLTAAVEGTEQNCSSIEQIAVQTYNIIAAWALENKCKKIILMQDSNEYYTKGDVNKENPDKSNFTLIKDFCVDRLGFTDAFINMKNKEKVEANNYTYRKNGYKSRIDHALLKGFGPEQLSEMTCEHIWAPIIKRNDEVVTKYDHALVCLSMKEIFNKKLWLQIKMPIKPRIRDWQEEEWQNFADKWELGESQIPPTSEIDPNTIVQRIKNELHNALKSAAGFTSGKPFRNGPRELANRKLDSAICNRKTMKAVIERFLRAREQNNRDLEHKLAKQMRSKWRMIKVREHIPDKFKIPEDHKELMTLLDTIVLEKRKALRLAIKISMDKAMEAFNNESKSMVELLKLTLFKEFRPPVLGVMNPSTGHLTASPKELSETLTSHFENILNSPKDEPPLSNEDQDLRASIFETKAVDPEIFNSLMNDVTEEEVVAAFPKNMVAAGEDKLSGGLYYKLVVHSAAFRKTVKDIFNRCLRQGVSLEEGKAAIICPIWKDLDKPASAENTRPISLQGALSKGIMKILADRLGLILSKNYVLDHAQEGFLPGKSTHRAIELLRAAWRRSRSEKTQCYTSLYDICKAYDHIRHEDILLAMKRINLPEKFIQLIKSSLEKLTARVRTGFGCGKSFKINRGIRQGCPLSPLLFIILFDIVHCGITELSEGISFGLDPKTKKLLKIGSVGYADDLAVLATSKDSLKKIHERICDITRALHLKINAPKSVIILPGKEQEDLNLEVDGIKIPTQTADKHFRYLGVPERYDGVTRDIDESIQASIYADGFMANRHESGVVTVATMIKTWTLSKIEHKIRFMSSLNSGTQGTVAILRIIHKACSVRTGFPCNAALLSILKVPRLETRHAMANLSDFLLWANAPDNDILANLTRQKWLEVSTRERNTLQTCIAERAPNMSFGKLKLSH